MPQPKPSAAIRITELLTELGISTHKLVMPTRDNFDVYEGVLLAAGALIDMKRQVDRVKQELRTLEAQRGGLIALRNTSRQVRSESVASTDTSATNRRSRQPQEDAIL